jgi:hypothetical protein
MTEDVSIAVKNPGADSNDGTSWDVLAANRVARSWDYTLGEPACSWMETKCLFDACVEVWKPLSFGEGHGGVGHVLRCFRGKCRINFLHQLAITFRILQ